MFLSVVIPAYNEEKRLPETLAKVRDYLMNQEYQWEVIVVNDGSKDGTGKIIGELIDSWADRKRNRGASFAFSRPSQAYSLLPARPKSNLSAEVGAQLDRHFAQDTPALPFPIRLIDYKVNRGKGAVVRQGMLEAKGDWRLFMDADGSTSIEEIEKLFTAINPKSEARSTKQYPNSNDINSKRLKDLDFENSDLFRISNFDIRAYDIIIGSRYLDKDSIKIKQPLVRRIVSRIGNIMVKVLLGLDFEDTQCGFKLFSARAAEVIFPLQTIERWGFDMEILAIAKLKHFKIKEVAVDWADAEGSQVRKSAALKTLRELWAIKKNIIAKKYQ